MIYFLCIIILVLLFTCVWLIKRCLDYDKTLNELDDVNEKFIEFVENSINVVARNIKTIENVAGMEVVSNEPFVKQVVNALNNSGVELNNVLIKMKEVTGDISEQEKSSTTK